MPNPMSDVVRKHSILFIFFLVLILRLVAASSFPVVQDEAYYFYWGWFPDFGYFDHPPMVAWLSAAGRMIGGSWLLQRSGPLLLALATFWLAYNFFRAVGLSLKVSRLQAVMLFNFNLMGLIFGFVVTPDVPLMFFWVLALHEAAYALRGQSWRWLTAGLVTGFGILSKYSMLLIGPVLLWGLIRKPGSLNKPWPYMGGLVCLLTLSPHLAWNVENNWLPVRFQFQHGLNGNHEVELLEPTKLPRPLPAIQGTYEMHLGRYFVLPEDLEKVSRPSKTEWQRFVQRLQDFFGGQLVIWGFLLFPIVWRLIEMLRGNEGPRDYLEATTQQLVHAATWFPLFIFGIAATRAPVEANWPAVYLLGASALLATRPFRWRTLAICAGINTLFVALLVLHANHPFPVKKPHKDRVLQETHGFKKLAAMTQHLDGLVFADTYQTVSMIKFYQPEVQIGQWPGATRFSELNRRASMQPVTAEKLLHEKRFWFITNNIIPPRFPGFQIATFTEVRDCLDRKGVVLSNALAEPFFKPPCKPYAHRWFLARYELLPPHDPHESDLINPL